MVDSNYSFESSGAFVSTFNVDAYNSGPLNNLTFAVKDNIDVAGHKTSYGSKPWRDKNAEAVYSAVCVEQLLGAGASCVGKTIADEYTYSLDGESYFYGTPINPKAPDRIPGGSSSGSASAVACGLLDFSLGTDSGGSIRVPASLCGVWGMRPSLHRISEAGVLPFMPSVSTVGAFAKNINTLDKVMRTLLRSQDLKPVPIRNLFLLEDAFSIADRNVSEAIKEQIKQLADTNKIPVTPITFSEIVDEHIDLNTCSNQALRILQSVEFANTVGGWVETFKPEMGPSFSAAYQNVRQLKRTEINKGLDLCERLFHKISRFTDKGDLYLYPSTATTAPLKGSLNNPDSVIDFYDRTSAITSFAGVGRLPEISIPLATVKGVPVGLSLATGYYQDEFLLSSVAQLIRS